MDHVVRGNSLCGVVWCVVWCGVVWCGVVWYRTLRVNGLLVAERPSNRLVYLRDGSAQTIVRAATLR